MSHFDIFDGICDLEMDLAFDLLLDELSRGLWVVGELF